MDTLSTMLKCLTTINEVRDSQVKPHKVMNKCIQKMNSAI